MATSQQQAPLALPSAAFCQSTGWRRGEELIDALPYIDPLAPDIKKQVDQMVEEEMRSSSKRPADYLKELPHLAPLKFEGHPMLQAEYERSDPTAWRAALDNAHAQLEHQLNRISNLELLLKFGPNTWRAQGQLDDAGVRQLEAALGDVRRAVDALNRERKLQQGAANLELRKLQAEWEAAVAKNVQIDGACSRLEDEVYAMEERLQRQQGQTSSAGAAAENGTAESIAGGGGGTEPVAAEMHVGAAGQHDAAADGGGGPAGLVRSIE